MLRTTSHPPAVSRCRAETPPPSIGHASLERNELAKRPAEKASLRSDLSPCETEPDTMETHGGESLIGKQLGRYRIEARLGAGGMGEVYRAFDVELHRPVALKTLRPEIATDRANLERFFAEARAANVIRHEHIIEYTDMHKAEPGGLSYVVMELLEGRSLNQAIRDSSRIPPERAVFIAAQVADALEAAHRAGIVHRDLKPDNVFLIRRMSTEDYVKVLDFGVARLRPDLTRVEATQSGMIIGTPAYMSPEQCKAEKVTPAADIYALGVILFKMLTGQLPFDAPTMPLLLVAHMTSEPPRVHALAPDVPASLSALVAQALAKQPDERPPSMAALRDAMLASVGLEALAPALTAPVPSEPASPPSAWAQGTPPARAPARTADDTAPEPMVTAMLHGQAGPVEVTAPMRGQAGPDAPARAGAAARGPIERPPTAPTTHGRPAAPRPTAPVAAQARDLPAAPPPGHTAPDRTPRDRELPDPGLVAFAPQDSDSAPGTTQRRDHPRPATPAPTLAPAPRNGAPGIATGVRRRIRDKIAELVLTAVRRRVRSAIAALGLAVAGGVGWGLLQPGATGTDTPEPAAMADAAAAVGDAVALRRRLDALAEAHGEPAAPAACQTEDPALLDRLVRAATLLQDGAPDGRRPQDIEAVHLLAAPPPETAEHWYWLAKARLYAEANVAAVTEVAGRALAACQGYAAAHNAVGSALFRERPAEAANAYGLAVALAPGFARARFNLGLIQLERGEVEDALASLSAILDGPDATAALRTDALLARGQAHLVARQPERAIADLTAATAAAPDDARAPFLLGQAYLLAGQADAATAAMCKAKALGHAQAAEHCP
jgi:serine/threonine protein kinase/tetratricopeptide (TPR) repeat protein